MGPSSPPPSPRNEVTRVANRNRPYVNDDNRLVLTWAHPQHSGQYRCYAMNPFGANTTYFNITIVYPSECDVVCRVLGSGCLGNEGWVCKVELMGLVVELV